MFYSESDTIVSDHPELAGPIRSIDRYLYELGDQLFGLERAADLLDMDPRALRRLLSLFENRGIVERVEVSTCPEDGEILEEDGDGSLWCDLCEAEYRPDECARAEVFRTRPGSAPSVPSRLAPFTQGHGVLVGVAAYHHLSRLSKATYDAQDLGDLLLDPVYAGYPRANVRLLLDDRATKGAINDELDKLARRAGSEDTVVIFFSGHGAQRVGGLEPGEYLCPVEADWSNLRGSAISTEELTSALGAIRAGRVALFLDACHSGGVGRPKDAMLQLQPGLSANAYERLAEGQGRVIIASCRPNEVSWELGGLTNGLFTHYLLEGLRGKAAGPDGAVRILDLFKYVSMEVPKRKDQHPLFKGTLEDNFAISVTAPGRR
jgi:hypothetical protein